MGIAPQITALVLAVVPAGTACAQETAAQYECVFSVECVNADRPCRHDAPLTATLKRSGNGWSLTGDGDAAIEFSELHGSTDAMLTLISTQGDPAASAVTMLSIAVDGQAFVSTHGVFLEPAAVLHVGICRRNGN